MKLKKEYFEHGFIPGKEEKILFLLYLKNKLQSTQLFRYSEMSKSAYLNVINDLIKKGLVKNEQSEDDRRVVFYSLSKEGQQYIKNEIDERSNYNFKSFLSFCMGLFYNKYPELKDEIKLNEFLRTFPQGEIEKIKNQIFDLAQLHFAKK
ncbi:MAG: MarR family transcriptional regulator [Candidatus Lokiarchaeota archaeon]|nr:MarR family transcriptional regulator [Candidatus Lokiarchaeota archaeon]